MDQPQIIDLVGRCNLIHYQTVVLPAAERRAALVGELALLRQERPRRARWAPVRRLGSALVRIGECLQGATPPLPPHTEASPR
jgi:hypothetical protein